MENGSDKITRNPLQELNPSKATDDHEIKTFLALRINSKKKWGGKKKKGHISLAQYIYVCNVIVSLLVSQIVA